MGKLKLTEPNNKSARQETSHPRDGEKKKRLIGGRFPEPPKKSPFGGLLSRAAENPRDAEKECGASEKRPPRAAE